MTITSKAAAKVAAVATGLAMATSMLSLAPIAHAACSVGTTDLTVGSSGAAVTCLQQGLIAAGYSIPAGATGYFGGQTKAAVIAWQKAAGISPAAGYFGPKSRAAFGGSSTSTTGGTSSVAGCAAGAMYSSTTGQACTTTTTSTGSLSGSGRLTNVGYAGNVTSDLKAGDAATNVIGMQADATGGDVAIQRVDATFVVSSATINSGTQSANLNKYVGDVSVYLDGVKLASMDPAMGDKSGSTWTLRFAGLNGVIKAGKTGYLYVKVTPLSTIGTHEDGGTVTAQLLTNSVRAVGADGISDTYLTRSGSTNDQAFTVKSATAATLTVTAGSDNPTASQVAVSSSTVTGVKLLSFNMKAKNQNVKVTALDAQFVTSDNSLNDVVANVYLMKGSTVLSSKTLTTGTAQTVTFNNLNDTIAKDATTNYTIIADLKGDSAYADGTTLVASTTASGGGWDVTDANGSTVTPSAAAVGNTMTLTATGISVARGAVSNTVAAGLTGAGDIATMVIPFTVTAGDNDVFIGGTATRGVAQAGTGVSYATTTTSTANATGVPTANLSVGNVVTGDSAGVYYKVLAGTSRTFTLTVAITATTTGATTAGYVGMQINSIGYGPTSSLGSYYTSNLDTFKTADMYVTKR